MEKKTEELLSIWTKKLRESEKEKVTLQIDRLKDTWIDGEKSEI